MPNKFIKQKCGYIYNINAYKNLQIKDGIISIEIQEKPRGKFKLIKMFLKSIENTNVFLLL